MISMENALFSFSRPTRTRKEPSQIYSASPYYPLFQTSVRLPPPPLPLLPIISRFLCWLCQNFGHRGKSFALFYTTFSQIIASILKFEHISGTNCVLMLISVMLTFSNQSILPCSAFSVFEVRSSVTAFPHTFRPVSSTAHFSHPLATLIFSSSKTYRERSSRLFVSKDSFFAMQSLSWLISERSKNI
jgi:hypothetical protein